MLRGVFVLLLLILTLIKTHGQNSKYEDFIDYARTSFGYDVSTLNRIICKMSSIEEASVNDAIVNMLEDRTVRLFSVIDDEVANVVQILLLYSMASVLLCSGTKGKRYAYPFSRIMMHQPMSSREDRATEIEVQKLKKELYEIISGQTGQSYEKILIDCKSDCWMNAQEACDYGLIDEIIKGIEKH